MTRIKLICSIIGLSWGVFAGAAGAGVMLEPVELRVSISSEAGVDNISKGRCLMGAAPPPCGPVNLISPGFPSSRCPTSASVTISTNSSTPITLTATITPRIFMTVAPSGCTTSLTSPCVLTLTTQAHPDGIPQYTGALSITTANPDVSLSIPVTNNFSSGACAP